MLVTESQRGDAPKPPFSIKTNKELEKSGNQGQINHRNWSLFLSLHTKSPGRQKSHQKADSEIVMVDLAFGDDFFEQHRSWDDFGTTISGI